MWRELAIRAVEPNPYLEPDFLVPSAQHFEGYADTTLVVAYEGDTFRGVLPIVRMERARIPPRMLACTNGRPAAVRCLGTPLVDADSPDLVLGTLLDSTQRAAKERGWPGILFMDLMDSDGPVIKALHHACGTRGLPVFTRLSWERGIVRRGGRWDRPLGKSHERQIAKARRALVRDIGAEVKLVDRTLDPSAIEEFVVMEASGWKGKEGGSAFAKDEHKVAWLRDWYRRWAPTGRLVILCLEVGDLPISFQICVRSGEGVFLFREAYDEAYARYGPGAMIIADTLEYLLKNVDAEWVDSGTDKDNAFLLEMLPERRTLSTLYIGVGGKLDRTIMAVLPAMIRLDAARHELRDRLTRKSSKALTTVQG